MIKEIIQHADNIKNNKEKVYPGMPLRFSEACTENDRIWQGDLALTITNKIPKGYTEKKDFNLQLVPGNTIGAKHCLDSKEGVKAYFPPEWDEDSLDGPILVLTEERQVLHPVHGNVTIPAGFTVNCTYQREFDAELRRERRAMD